MKVNLFLTHSIGVVMPGFKLRNVAGVVSCCMPREFVIKHLRPIHELIARAHHIASQGTSHSNRLRVGIRVAVRFSMRFSIRFTISIKLRICSNSFRVRLRIRVGPGIYLGGHSIR